MITCILCMENVNSQQQKQSRHIEIFSKEGIELGISVIIAKHFWLRPSGKQFVCVDCWEAVLDFHRFYERVAKVHKCLEVPTLLEDDPLPDEGILLKSEEEVSCAGQLVAALGDNFFDTEVKVEVHDLDLLPQVEIIEDALSNLSQRAQRATRRAKNTPDDGTPQSISNAKRIKREISPYTRTSSAESEAELPLSVLLHVSGIKTDEHETTTTGDDSKKTPRQISNNTVNSTQPQRRRRGRPRKVKVEENPPEAETYEVQSTRIKTENVEKESDAEVEQDSLDIDSGTEDSDSSSSSGDSSDNDDSLPDIEPAERFAEIPKRVVVKPKKYRKRPKPLVPPRRMTREEIDRRKAQQDEYDNVIRKFFGKFSCPKCNLLVQNFGDMKRHFRISHNIDPGYMMCCGRKFHVRKALAEHVCVHWNPEHFKCNVCERVMQDSRSLEVHEQSHTQPPAEPKDKKVFQCDKCPKTFTTKAAFEYHTYSKHVPKSEFQFTCPECSKKLPTQRKLKDHMKYMHDPESAIICDKCGKQVRSQSNLKKHHQLEHSDMPRPAPVPMQCEICGTWLRHIAGLKQHMKTIHEDAGGEHRCHICNKTSTNARALKRHIYHNHECERKFKCTMCEKAFKRPQDLREHTSTHTGEVLYTCPNCPMTFFSNANMYKHRQRLHRAEWEADRKKPVPPNIMQQAVGATAAMRMQQAVGATHAFFAQKLVATQQAQTHAQSQGQTQTQTRTAATQPQT